MNNPIQNLNSFFTFVVSEIDGPGFEDASFLLGQDRDDDNAMRKRKGLLARDYAWTHRHQNNFTIILIFHEKK